MRLSHRLSRRVGHALVAVEDLTFVLAPGFPAEVGFTRAFVMEALEAAATLAASALLPGRHRGS